MTKKLNFSHPKNFSKIGVTPGYSTPPDASFVSGTAPANPDSSIKSLRPKSSEPKKANMPDAFSKKTIPKP